MSAGRCGTAAWLAAVLTAGGLIAAASPGPAASAATPPALHLKILLIGEGSSDVTTTAWRSALDREGVPYTLVTATGTAPDKTVVLPALSSSGTGDYNGVVIADSRTTTPQERSPRWTASLRSEPMIPGPILFIM